LQLKPDPLGSAKNEMASAGSRPVNQLVLADLAAHPVWRFVNDDSRGETSVRAVRHLPVAELTNHLVATSFALPNGSQVWGLLGNLDLTSAEKTSHFLSLSILSRGRWFHLARYHDLERAGRGPEALASFLGLAVSEVFPLTYDISNCCVGLAEVVRGAVPAEPLVRLSRTELVALAVP